MSLLAQDLACQVAENIRALTGNDAEVWAVTHSLGGIILRHIMGLPDQGERGDLTYQDEGVAQSSTGPWCCSTVHCCIGAVLSLTHWCTVAMTHHRWYQMEGNLHAGTAKPGALRLTGDI